MLHIWYKSKLYFAVGLNIDFIYYFIQERTNFRSLLTYWCILNQKWLIMGNFDVNKSWDDYLKRMRNVLSSPDRYYRLLQNLDLLIVLKRISFIIIQRQSVNIKDERNQQCLYCNIYTYHLPSIWLMTQYRTLPFIIYFSSYHIFILMII